MVCSNFAKMDGLAQQCLAELPKHGIVSWSHSSIYEFLPVKQEAGILSESNCYPSSCATIVQWVNIAWPGTIVAYRVCS